MNIPRPAVLIAEDNRALCHVLKFNLERAGFEVVLVYDGQQAVEALQSRGFDLLLTDLDMPVMSGWELCKHLRQEVHLTELPIAVCSARGLEFKLRRFIEDYNLIRVFYKPASPQSIVEFAQDLLQPVSAI